MKDDFESVTGPTQTTSKGHVVKWSKGVIIVGTLLGIEAHISYLPQGPRGEVEGFYIPKDAKLTSHYAVIDMEGKKRIVFMAPGLEQLAYFPDNITVKIECTGSRFIPVLGRKGLTFDVLYSKSTLPKDGLFEESRI